MIPAMWPRHRLHDGTSDSCVGMGTNTYFNRFVYLSLLSSLRAASALSAFAAALALLFLNRSIANSISVMCSCICNIAIWSEPDSPEGSPVTLVITAFKPTSVNPPTLVGLHFAYSANTQVILAGHKLRAIREMRHPPAHIALPAVAATASSAHAPDESVTMESARVRSSTTMDVVPVFSAGHPVGCASDVRVCVPLLGANRESRLTYIAAENETDCKYAVGLFIMRTRRDPEFVCCTESS
ncbi:hypothetical protein MRX96_022342 [Rhipicephalus microplus]